MTNFLSTAMLSAGAACFGSIIEIEKNMSQAEINTLIASEEMMKAQPTLMTALQNSYEAKAHDTLVSGLIGGVGGILAGGAQLGLVGYGMYDAKTSSAAELEEPNTLRVNSEQVPQPRAVIDGTNNPAELESLPDANQPAERLPENNVVREEVVAENAQQNAAEETDAAKKTEKRKKAAAARYNEISNRYNTFVQIAGPGINSLATASKTSWDMDLVKKDGTAQAVGTVIQGNQTAQSSNASMAQTYKEAFTNASQILAGIVSAQRG